MKTQQMKTLCKYAGSYILAVMVAAVLGSAMATQFVLAGLIGLGIDIPFGVRVSTTVHDIWGMTPTLGSMVAVGFFISFLTAGLCARFLRGSRPLWFAAAGGCSILVAFCVVYNMIGGTLIAGARTLGGQAAQVLICAAAGWTFARLTAKAEARET